jgi:hypothetical protein
MEAVGSFCGCLKVGTSKQPKSENPGLSNFPPPSESQTPPPRRGDPSSDISINNGAPTEKPLKGILKKKDQASSNEKKTVTFAKKLVPSANSSSIDSDDESKNGDAGDDEQS